MAKRKKPKAANYILLPNATGAKKPEPWRLLEDAVAAHHPHLAEAKFAVVWRRALKPDPDGKLVLGRARKASDFDKELADYDLVVILNESSWFDLTPEQRAALIEHEINHFGVAVDKNGDEKRDERGRLIYRLRRHDIEEFTAVVERHGVWKKDLEEFARAAEQKRKTPLFPESEPVAGKVGT